MRNNKQASKFGFRDSLLSAFGAVLLMSGAQVAQGCTDFMLPTINDPPEAIGPDGDIYQSAVSARTMDFAVNLAWFLETQNDAVDIQSSEPPDWGAHGLKWKSKYKLVGFRGAHDVSRSGEYFDGMNEKGLSAALLWLEKAWPQNGDDQYPDPQQGNNNLSIKYVVNYLLSSCDNVPCAVRLLKQQETRPTVWGEPLKILGIFPIKLALHLVMHDADNKTAVVEWYNKKQFIYDDQHNDPAYRPDKIRVLANDPPFVSQVDALWTKEFSLLTRKNHFKESNADETLPHQNFLPGDTSSGSRFIRTYKLNRSVGGDKANVYEPIYPGQFYREKLKPNLWRVMLANRIIARAEEVYGEYPVDTYVPFQRDGFFHTMYTVIRDHTNRNLYVRGVYNPNLRRISLNGLFATKPANYSKQYVDPYPEKFPDLKQYQDVSESFKNELPDQ